MDKRLKGNSLTVGNDDSETTPNSDGSQFSKPSTDDEHLSMLIEQGICIKFCCNCSCHIESIIHDLVSGKHDIIFLLTIVSKSGANPKVFVCVTVS